mgnify:CR=1 FL=1
MAEKRKKEKSLKPSLRENKRYLLIEGNIGKEEIEKAILDYVGILGWAKACPVFVSHDVLAVNREELERIKASFELAGIRIRRISGTLKGLEK